MALGTAGDGGAAVAQPAREAPRLVLASCACYALIALALAVSTAVTVSRACGGSLGAPLDDSYIHFQFARSFARLRPFEYAPGLPAVPGATSLLWPALFTPALWLGAGARALVALAYCLGFASLFGQACEAFLAARRFLSWPPAFCGGLLVLALSANTWFAASGMEVVALGFLLLRSARLAAEYIEGGAGRSLARARQLWLLGAACVLLRPEGVLGVLAVAAAFALGPAQKRWHGAAALGLALLPPLVNLLLTGSLAQTTTLAKWLPVNPYYSGQLTSAVLGNVRLFFDVLLDGRQWSWTFIPEGYRLLGWISLPALCVAAARRGAPAHAACLCLVALGVLIPTSYETFLVNRLRYLWPFSAPWLLGLAALGELCAAPLQRFSARLLALGAAVPLACAVGFARLAPISLADLAQSAAAIDAQQVSLGKWAKRELAPDSKLGVNDAGAIAFFSERPTFDVVGLTTRGEARYWVAGAGSRFEHYERLGRGQLPSHFIVYPEWFAIPPLLGECLTERVVKNATILGGPRMVACRADYSSLGSGARPKLDVGRRALLDELDVADLESEAAHGYLLGAASAASNLVVSDAGLSDGGRSQRQYEAFELRVEPGGLLIVRLGSDVPTTLTLTIAGQPALELDCPAAAMQELSFSVPQGVAAARAAVTLRSRVPLATFHYWSYAVL